MAIQCIRDYYSSFGSARKSSGIQSVCQTNEREPEQTVIQTGSGFFISVNLAPKTEAKKVIKVQSYSDFGN